MAVKLFAAILIGSTETEMRVYELGARGGMKQVDHVSTRIGLGSDAYSDGRLDTDVLMELCRVLRDMRLLMDSYKVDSYRACATSSLRELRSDLLTRDFIEKQTGLKITIISNSEQRFLDYKAIACECEAFDKIIANGTAIIDIGGNSMQLSIFDKDKLVTTQNIRLGKISARDQYEQIAADQAQYRAIVQEILDHELNGFAKLYQKERPIQNLFICDPDLMELARTDQVRVLAGQSGPYSRMVHVTSEKFTELYRKLLSMKADEAASQFEISIHSAHLVSQSLLFINCIMERMGASELYLMDVSVCDGLCYDFGVSSKLLKQKHNFEEDIIAASRNIAKRYKSNQPHIRHMEELCVEIFNKTRKIHGMKNRERLLLQIAAILHNCGKYISLSNVSECAYYIIMATEIIGLTHNERKMIAHIVRFNNKEFHYYHESDDTMDLTMDEYLTVAKLTAILRVANALDRSHRQKCAGAQIVLRDDELLINVNTDEDLSLERKTLADRESFFVEVFNIHPVLHQKKRM